VDIAEPHLVEMVEDFAKIAFEKVRDDALFGMFKSSIDRLGLGCVIFDHKGQIAFANDAARMLLSRSGTRRSVSVPKGTATALPKLLANLATDERIRLNNDSKSGAYVVRPFALPDGTIRPAYICSFASKGEGAAVGDARRCYTVFIPTHKGVSDVRALKIAFQLTRKEARLAHLIASGRTVQESAVDMDWKVNSARTYLKRVFAKVGVASQAQLTATAARLYVPETNDSSWDDTLESMDED
jgi:DNA-binding CsgD family transcriptional regulator